MNTRISKASRFFSFLFSDYPGEKFHKRSWAFWERALTFVDRSCQYTIGAVVLGVKKTVLRNKKYFYKNFISSDHSFLVFLSNIARPKRFMKKVLYGQVVKLPSTFSLSKPYKAADIDPRAHDLAKKLKENGAVFLPERYEAFADYIIEEFLKKKEGVDIYAVQPDENKKWVFNMQEPTQPILEFALDPLILSTLALYLGCQPYVMHVPTLSIIYPSNAFLNTREVNPATEGFSEQGWHFDTVNLVQATILINDVMPEDSHMEIVRGEHKRHRMNVSSKDYLYSEEYIDDKYEVFHCCGKKGTVYLFDPNSPHRLHFAKDSMRVKFKTMYTPGNDTRGLRNPHDNSWISLKGIDSSRLNDMQKEALFFLQKDKVFGCQS